ncbi:MAG: hypothetical protein ACYC3B_02985 [Sedimentisphaerales bacterium]
MGVFKNTNLEEINKLMDKFIYPKQFKNEVGLIYHIINFCYPLCKSFNSSKSDEAVIHYKERYTKRCSTTSTSNYNKLMERFDKEKATIYRPDCFTHLQDVLEPEDYVYIHNHKRYIAIKEIIYMAYRITQIIGKSTTGSHILPNNYFKTTGFKKEYEKFTGKKYTNEKYANILKVLQKHKYLFISKNAKNNNIYMIGMNSPYYQLSQVKNIVTEEVPEVRTSLEEMVKKLEHEKNELKNMLEANKADYLSAKDSNKKIEQLVELLEEKEQEIMKLEKNQVKKRKWCICNKPIVVVKRQDTFEQDLYNLISGRK